jgi:hypothetical protein
MEALKSHWSVKVLIFLFVFLTGWWVYMSLFLPKDNPSYAYFGTLYGIIALWGGIWGLIISRQWGGFRSMLGRAIIMFSLGLFAQEFGQCSYTYYIFVLHIDVPYPSIGDLGFFGAIPFYIYGAYLLAKVSGVNVSVKSFKNKVQAIIIPVAILGVAYVLFLRNYPLDFTHPLETFLNYGYPFGQAIFISIGILTYSLTRNILGGIMKPKIMFLIVAFASQFLADYSFVFFADKYYPGSIFDYLYVVAYFLMAYGIFQLRTVITERRSQH